MADIPVIGATQMPDLNFIQKFPQAKTAKADTGETGKKMDIASSWCGNAVANQSTFPENPESNNYVIGVNGRGSLQIAPGEFDDLFACMLGIARMRAGYPPSEVD